MPKESHDQQNLPDTTASPRVYDHDASRALFIRLHALPPGGAGEIRRRQIRDQLCNLNQGLVHHTLRQLHLPSSGDSSDPDSGEDQHDDLFQQGLWGLVEAINRYDARRGTRFSTFAVPFIRGKILSYLTKNVPTIASTRSERDLQREISRVRARLESQTGQTATVYDIARELGWDEERVIAALARRKATASVGSIDDVLDWHREERGSMASEPVPFAFAPAENLTNDDRHAFGIQDGEIFRWAALLAPLQPSWRNKILSYLWREREGRVSWPRRCEERWQDLVWAGWLLRRDSPLREPVVRALERDLRNPSYPLRREHAAFVVWAIHAVPSVRALCPGTQENDYLRRLGEAVLSAALEWKQDVLLQHLAIKIWFGTDALALISDPRISTALLRHSVRHSEAGERGVHAAVRRGINTIADETAGVNELFLLWDAAATNVGLRVFPDVQNLGTTKLPSEMRRRWGCLRAGVRMISDPDEAVTLLEQTLRDNGDYGFSRISCTGTSGDVRLGRIISDLLGNASGRLPAVLLRRSAAGLIHRFEDPALRRQYGLRALADPAVFVRHSAVRVLREELTGDESSLEAAAQKTQNTERLNLLRALEEALDTYGQTDKRPVELMMNVLDVLCREALQRPSGDSWQQQTIERCRVLAFEHRHPEVRGKALAWLGELERTSGKRLLCGDDLCFRLLGGMERECASNIAQALVAPLGLPVKPRPLAAYGVLERYAVPLWRTDLG